MRARATPTNPQTPDQQANRARLAKAARAWSDLDSAQAQRWHEYAESLAAKDARAGYTVSPQAMNVFTTLYGKRLRLDPDAAPTDPPTLPFPGDSVDMAVSGLVDGVRFVAASANAPGVTTELLVQPLASAHRRAYAEKYRTRGFAAFLTGGQSFDVIAPTGVYACAYRFVELATGRETALNALGLVVAG